MRRLRFVAALLGCWAGLSGSSVAGAAEKLGALLPQTRPPAAAEVRDRFHEAVVRGLTGGGDEVVPAAETRMRLSGYQELLECNGSGACVARVAQTLGIQRIVVTDIDINGKDYAIKMRLVDAVGRELTKVEEPCDICTVKEADDAVARAAGKLAAAAHTLLGDGSAVAKPDATKPEPAKTEPPKAEPPKTTPPPPPAVAPPPPPTPEPTPLVTPTVEKEKKMFPWRPVAITSLVVGVVLTAIGIPLIAIDGNPTCNSPNPRTTCPDVYDTKGGGGALLAFGIGGIAAGGVLFYFDHRARTKKHNSVSLVPGGGLDLRAGGTY